MLRRSRAKTIVLVACAIGVVFFILSRILGGANGVPSGTPPVVIVTVLDTVGYSKEYQDSVKENRIQYARKHGKQMPCEWLQLAVLLFKQELNWQLLGYTTFFPSIGDYDIQGSPNSWSKVPAARHALSKFPHSEYIWVLEQNALIMNPALKVEDHIMAPKRLESLMVKDQSIVPPDSVIKTFPNLKGENVDLVLTQDKDGLSQASFIIRRGEWSKFFLDTWFDPLYRSYNFQKADLHALVSGPVNFPGKFKFLQQSGTYRTMASNDLVEVGTRATENNECIQFGWGRRV